VKPVIAVVVSAEGVPHALRGSASAVVALPYPESAARALALAAKRADWLRTPAGELPEVAGIDPEAGRAIVEAALGGAGDLWLDPAATQALLDAYGIPTVRERVAATVDDAVAAAAELGYPAVVKTAAPGVHKTDVGGVALDLRTEEQVRAAVERIGVPVLVQPFLGGRIELLAGIVQDPMFGPLVAFGPGGALAELIGDASFRLAPLTDRDADELVREGKAGRLVAGFRGAEPADAAALVELALRLGRLAEDLPQVAELDLNPVLAGPTGCMAVDARVRVRVRLAERRVKGW
jgi:acyl-CoA synthetase (NDP forming)